MFLLCSFNNKVDRVSNLFEHALNDFGTISRIRTNKSGEKVRIFKKMTELKGENGRSNLDGFSMYNKGIESLSRNV